MKEKNRGHHFLPRTYLKRFSWSKKRHLNIEFISGPDRGKKIQPTVANIFKEKGIYDLTPYLESGSSLHGNIESNFLESLLLAKIHEPQLNRALKHSIDCDLVPTLEYASRIALEIWVLYLRNPVTRATNEAIRKEVRPFVPNRTDEFLGNFGMVTSKCITKLYPKVFKNVRHEFLYASGLARFLTTDNPSIPCIYNHIQDRYEVVERKSLQKSVILEDKWPENVGLICPLSPRWVLNAVPVKDISHVVTRDLLDTQVQLTNEFLKKSAQQFVVYPPTTIYKKEFGRRS